MSLVIFFPSLSCTMCLKLVLVDRFTSAVHAPFLSVRVSSLDVRRQILTSKDGPRAERDNHPIISSLIHHNKEVQSDLFDVLNKNITFYKL